MQGRSSCVSSTHIIEDIGLQDCPEIISTVRSALKDAPVKRLRPREDGTLRTPLEVMTGIKPNRMPNTVINLRLCLRADRSSIITRLDEKLEAIHKYVLVRCDKERERARVEHNKKTNANAFNFAVGDYIMVKKATTKVQKLDNKWTGPRWVVEVRSDSIYNVQKLMNENRSTVHSSHLMFIVHEVNLDMV